MKKLLVFIFIIVCISGFTINVEFTMKNGNIIKDAEMLTEEIGIVTTFGELEFNVSDLTKIEFPIGEQADTTLNTKYGEIFKGNIIDENFSFDISSNQIDLSRSDIKEITIKGVKAEQKEGNADIEMVGGFEYEVEILTKSIKIKSGGIELTYEVVNIEEIEFENERVELTSLKTRDGSLIKGQLGTEYIEMKFNAGNREEIMIENILKILFFEPVVEIEEKKEEVVEEKPDEPEEIIINDGSIELLSPINNEKVQRGIVELNWQSSGMMFYIYFGKDTLEYIGSTNEKNYKVLADEYDTEYQWKLETDDKDFNIVESRTESFRTKENRAPENLKIISPENYSANLYIIVDFSWECSDPDGDDMKYIFHIKERKGEEETIETNEKELTKKLEPNTPYICYFEAIDEFGAKSTSGNIVFTTKNEGVSLMDEEYNGEKDEHIKENSDINESNKNIESNENQNPFEMNNMILVEGGTFMMGSANGDSDEKPVHKVTLNYDYYIGKYEVTFDEYDKYCEETGKDKPSDEGWGRGQRPVINLSWYEAIEYCNWISEMEGISEAYDEEGNLLDKYGNNTTDITKVVGYRLPTEAEWEFAARGGNESINYIYSGSNNIDEVAWYKDNSEKLTHEVGTKIPNELGIFDMSGNVWEWCNDYYKKYVDNKVINPINNTSSTYKLKIVRGGCYRNEKSNCRISNRLTLDYFSKTFSKGFRICRTE